MQEYVLMYVLLYAIREAPRSGFYSQHVGSIAVISTKGTETQLEKLSQ